MHWKGLHAVRWSLNSKVGVDPLSGSIGLWSSLDALKALDVARDIALDVTGALDAIDALDLESATGGSLGIAIGGIRDHWIRDCFRNRSFRIYNFTHFFRSSLEGQR